MIAEATIRLLLLVFTYLFVFFASKAHAVDLEKFDFTPYTIQVSSKDLQSVISSYQIKIKSRTVHVESPKINPWPSYITDNFNLLAKCAAARTDYFDLNPFDGLGAGSRDNHVVINVDFIKNIIDGVGGDSAATPLINFILGHEIGHDIYEIGNEELRAVVTSRTGLKLPSDGSDWYYDPRYDDSFKVLSDEKKEILITDSIIKNSQLHALVDIIGIEVLRRAGFGTEGVVSAQQHFLKFMQSPDINIPPEIKQRAIIESHFRIWNLKNYLSRKH